MAIIRQIVPDSSRVVSFHREEEVNPRSQLLRDIQSSSLQRDLIPTEVIRKLIGSSIYLLPDRSLNRQQARNGYPRSAIRDQRRRNDGNVLNCPGLWSINLNSPHTSDTQPIPWTGLLSLLVRWTSSGSCGLWQVAAFRLHAPAQH